MNAEVTGLQLYFPEQIELANRQAVIGTWGLNLKKLIGDLSVYEKFNSEVTQELNQAIDIWQTHLDHGASHSFDVYQGMITLAKNDGRWDQNQDSMFQAGAVLHDLFQTLPFKNPYTGNVLKGEARLRHPETMAMAIRAFGERLGVSRDELRPLVTAILRHDDSYRGHYHENLPYLAQVLADSDKLLGAGPITDIREAVRKTIERNLTGTRQPGGWYILRNLTQEERKKWRYGARWSSDTVSAVRVNFLETQFYTLAGQKLGDQRRIVFLEEVLSEQGPYAEVYDESQATIKHWQDALTDQKSTVVVSLVGKDQEPMPVDAAQPPEETIVDAFSRHLPLAEKYILPGFSSDDLRGWKIQVTINGEMLPIIDPSVARFKTKTEFLEALGRVFTT